MPLYNNEECSSVDTPVANPAASAESCVLDMTALALAADTDYFGAVVPTNQSGFADPPATFQFRTDGDGNPSITPAAVTNLQAVPLAGGRMRITWEYDEPNPLAVADSFYVAVHKPTSGAFVQHTQLQRRYTYEPTNSWWDGLWKVTVNSVRDGVSSPIATVTVRTDTTPPAAAALAISAT